MSPTGSRNDVTQARGSTWQPSGEGQWKVRRTGPNTRVFEVTYRCEVDHEALAKRLRGDMAYVGVVKQVEQEAVKIAAGGFAALAVDDE